MVSVVITQSEGSWFETQAGKVPFCSVDVGVNKCV